MEPSKAASGRRFVIATPHVLATQAGLEAATAGGTAVDAALAANAVLTVVYPHMCTIGGDLFALLAQPDGHILAINGSGAAAQGVDRGAILQNGATMPLVGPLTINVPGTVAAWATLCGLGARFDLGRALEPAVRHAMDGALVAPSLARALDHHGVELGRYEAVRQVLFRGGRPLREGEKLQQIALAETLEAIAADGPPAFYGGRVGEKLVAGLRATGSPLALEDLAAHATEITEPLRHSFRGWEVSTTPPNSQGVLLLEILGALESLTDALDPLGPDAPLMAEVFRIASLDRDRYLADPRRRRVPLDALLGQEHLHAIADMARARIETGEGAPGQAAPLQGDTIAIVAADDRGQAVVLIQSIFHTFGSRILELSTGILCQNRAASFSLDPSVPNCLEGGKRPAHTLMPVMVRRDGRLTHVSGTMGGTAQPQIQAHLLARMLDLRMAPAEAVVAPRWVVGGLELGTRRDIVYIEGRAAPLARSFEAAGMPVGMLKDFDEEVGHAQVIDIGEGGVLAAASDPRADGAAAAL